MPEASSDASVRLMLATPSRSISTFAARLPDAAIIVSHSERNASGLPIARYVSPSESSSAESVYGLPSARLLN